jgi:phage gp29-like protein
MDTPKTESLNVEEIKEALDSITPESTKEELYKKIDFFVKQLNLAYETNRKNVLVLTEALEQSQSLYKKYEADQMSTKNRLKRFIKKVFIAKGWYEASYEELKGIHEARKFL